MTLDSRLFEGVHDAVRQNEAAPAKHSAPHLNIVTLANVEPESVEWLWRGRLPRGKVTLIVGDPGSGKSFLTNAMSAAITIGKALPDSDAVDVGSVLIWNGEDGIADTIRVRVGACGADLSRVHVIESATDHDGVKRSFGLLDIPLVGEELRRRRNISMVVVDPIAALLADVDSHNDTEVRGALQSLVDLAREHRTAVVVVMHMRKSEAQRAIYRVGGSIGFVGLARSVLLVAKDEESGRRAVVPIKQNLCAEVPPIEFRIDTEGLFWWKGVADDLDAARLLSSPIRREIETGVDRAAALLQDKLSAGERPMTELRDLAKEQGISEKSLRTAADKLGIKKRKGGFDGPWLWGLTEDAQATPKMPKMPKILRQRTRHLRALGAAFLLDLRPRMLASAAVHR